MLGSVNSVESLGTVDGPGIRAVIFLNGCSLRCKYCHNPETWIMQEKNYEASSLVEKVIRYKPYFNHGGGVTFSGGEPLLQPEFLIECSRLFKENGINVALDTAGAGIGNYEEILKYTDLIIFDVKDVTKERFFDLTGGNIENTWQFLDIARKMNSKFWIRQVIIPGVNDTFAYMEELDKYIKDHINIDNVERVEFLPYHKLGTEKYEKLHIFNPYQEKEAMDATKCKELNDYFISIFKK